VSLLLLFLSGEHGPQLSGSSAAAAGAAARSVLSAKTVVGAAAAGAGGTATAKGKIGALPARAVGGGWATAVGFRGAFQTATASAGDSSRARASASTRVGATRSDSGALARGIGGKGMRSRTAVAAGATARQRTVPLRVGTPILRLTRLVLFLDASEIPFTKVGESGPYAMLLSIGTLRLAARAGNVSGIGVTESTSVTVQLDNTGRRVSRIIGRPLRARAEIYDGEDLFFVGTVSAIRYGQTVDITLEA
jgi:hypothetical protein